MVALEDVETQKRGVVLVSFHFQHQDGYNFTRERLNQGLHFVQGTPFKIMGIHFCCSEESMPFLLPFQNMIQYLIGSDGRRHFRAHRGKNTDVYALQAWVITCYNLLLEQFDSLPFATVHVIHHSVHPKARPWKFRLSYCRLEYR